MANVRIRTALEPANSGTCTTNGSACREPDQIIKIRNPKRKLGLPSSENRRPEMI